MENPYEDDYTVNFDKSTDNEYVAWLWILLLLSLVLLIYSSKGNVKKWPTEKPIIFFLGIITLIFSLIGFCSEYDLAVALFIGVIFWIINRIKIINEIIYYYTKKVVVLFKNKEKERKIAQYIIDCMHHYYNMAKLKYPNKKEIFYLSLAWVVYAIKHYPKKYKNMDLDYLLVLAVSDALFFSYLEYPESIDALSIYIIHKEDITIPPKHEEKFYTITTKININNNHKLDDAIKEAVQYLISEAENIGEINEDEF